MVQYMVITDNNLPNEDKPAPPPQPTVNIVAHDNIQLEILRLLKESIFLLFQTKSVQLFTPPFSDGPGVKRIMKNLHKTSEICLGN